MTADAALAQAAVDLAVGEVPRFPLIVAMFTAPLVCVDPDAVDELHAATMEAIAHAWSGEHELVAACGAGAMKLLPSSEEQGIPWPPRVASLPPGWTRCRACHTLTGRRRPRSEWRLTE